MFSSWFAPLLCCSSPQPIFTTDLVTLQLEGGALSQDLWRRRAESHTAGSMMGFHSEGCQSIAAFHLGKDIPGFPLAVAVSTST